MKRFYKILVVCGLVVTATSCKKYLDVNTNPNNPITSTPDLVLPQALVSTAAYTVQFNTYGGYTDGMIANAGGFGAFGAQTTYNFATTDYTNLFSNSYDNINDYQYVIANSTPDGTLRYFNAAARIMRVFAYQRLVDTYGDIPYTDAVKGTGALTPKYDKAEDIYADLFAQLNTAIASIDATTGPAVTQLGTGSNGKIDVLFGGDMTKWKAFANTIKLRLLIRLTKVDGTPVPALATVYNAEKAKLAGATSATFLADDAIVQPGYAAGQAGKQNPMWNTWAYNEAGTATNTGIAQEPTFYAVGFYSGNKLTDAGRGPITFRSYTSATGQLGSSTNPTAPSGSAWYTGVGTGTSGNGVGILKGPMMGQPIMLLAESFFLQAEANVWGIYGSLANANGTTGNFRKGIDASFRYLYKDQTGNFSYTVKNAAGAVTKAYTEDQSKLDAATYVATNSASPLVVLDNNTTNIGRLEAIITQKWIAMNMITGDEAYNEYRRTGFPRVASGSPFTTPASTISTSTAPDRLPTRIQYPNQEYSLNSANVPAAVNNFTSKIFWDLN